MSENNKEQQVNQLDEQELSFESLESVSAGGPLIAKALCKNEVIEADCSRAWDA
jgi:hypothetical protein